MSAQHGIKYRPDIDGLRAIAVLSVFAFHLGMYRFARGGFVGVDVFFVISGYLITGIIDREIHAGTFRITVFYRRRALRILPAFVAVVLATAGVSLFLLPPVEVTALGKAIAAAGASVSNILFYFAPSGYFFNDLNARPLLHTWSLGVEEQFYFLFPLLLIAGYRLGRPALALLLAGLGIASFIVSTVLLRSNPNAAFFLLPARFWELMLGAVAALGLLRLPASKPLREAAGFAGLAMVLYGIATIDGGYLPYYWALLPCGGAVLIILSSEGAPSLAGRLLSLRPMVWVGLISYSLYLWHWPMIVFVHLGLERPLTLASKSVIVAASFVLAIASWWFIERPFRRIPKVFRKPVVLRPALAVICAVILLGAVFAAAGGFPARFSREANQVSAYLDPRPVNLFRAGTCFISAPNENFDWDTCLGRDTGAPRLILFGDSHAADLWLALKDNSRGFSLRQVTATYCPPLLPSYATGLPFCTKVVGRFFGDYLKASHPRDTIMMSERWNPGQLADLKTTIRAFRKTGAHVVVVGPAPEYDMALPRLEFASLVRGDPTIIRRAEVVTIPPLDAALHRVADDEHAQYVSLVGALCSRDGCRPYAAPNVPMLLDTDHLTTEGARLISPLLIAAVEHPRPD